MDIYKEMRIDMYINIQIMKVLLLSNCHHTFAGRYIHTLLIYISRQTGQQETFLNPTIGVGHAF